MKEIEIHTEEISLDQLLKYEGLAESGGAAKRMILQGDIWVNGESCQVIRKKIKIGDRVDVPDEGSFLIVKKNEN